MAEEGHRVQVATRVLGTSESGFYAWRTRAPSARAIRHVILTDTIRQIHANSNGVYGAIAMKDALQATMATMPSELLRSLTWDRGKELSAHAHFTIATGMAVYFADPHSPWQRGTNENTNGVLRQYFPKGTDLSRWPAEDLLAVQAAINSRPRKVLGWRTPAEVLDEQLRSLHKAGVARTG